LGEIEGTLAQCPGVQQVAVLVREDRPGDRRLVAYVVCDRVSSLAGSELRDFVKSKLPEYMVPSRIVFLDAMPLTANGKVDRGSLPAPDGRGDEGEGRFVAPRDKVEFRLVKIWQDVLGVDSVGVRDNFFELGGHSLLAMRLLARVEKEFNRPVSVAAFFQGPTVEKLSAMLREGGVVLNWKWLVPLQPVGSKRPLLLLHASRELGHQIDEDQPVYGLRPHGLDGSRVPLSVEEMATEYIEEIRLVQTEGPYVIGGFSFGGLIAFELARQLRDQGQEVAILLLLDPTRPDYGKSGSAVSSKPGIRGGGGLRRLAAVGVRDAAASIGEKVRWRVDRVKNRVKMLVCGALLSAGRRVPVGLRRFYIMEKSRQAARRYVPGVYSGHVVLLITGASEKSSLAWSPLISGELEIHEMTGRHLDVIEGDYVKAWAGRIRTCLQKVQTTAVLER